MELEVWEKKFRNIEYDVFEWKCCGRTWQLLDDSGVRIRNFEPACPQCFLSGKSIEEVKGKDRMSNL